MEETGKNRGWWHRPTRYDWWVLALLLLLLGVWFATGREAWLRYLIMGLTLGYLLVARVLINYRRLKR